jgi:hypothetical protein
MFKMTTTSTNAFLTVALMRALYFFYCGWWNWSTGNFSFMPRVLQYSSFCGIHSVLYPTGESLKVLSQEIGMDTLYFSLSCPSSREMSIEKVSHIGVVMWWHTIMLKATFFI